VQREHVINGSSARRIRLRILNVCRKKTNIEQQQLWEMPEMAIPQSGWDF
jgi:hypothetical protein